MVQTRQLRSVKERPALEERVHPQQKSKHNHKGRELSRSQKSEASPEVRNRTRLENLKSGSCRRIWAKTSAFRTARKTYREALALKLHGTALCLAFAQRIPGWFQWVKLRASSVVGGAWGAVG